MAGLACGSSSGVSRLTADGELEQDTTALEPLEFPMHVTGDGRLYTSTEGLGDFQIRRYSTQHQLDTTFEMLPFASEDPAPVELEDGTVAVVLFDPSNRIEFFTNSGDPSARPAIEIGNEDNEFPVPLHAAIDDQLVYLTNAFEGTNRLWVADDTDQPQVLEISDGGTTYSAVWGEVTSAGDVLASWTQSGAATVGTFRNPRTVNSQPDDGTDADLDTITDCVETNGAFTPAAQAIAGPGDRPIVTGYEDSYITTNPNNADTDNDGIDDNIELVEADLRDDALVAQTYAYLIDQGVTSYYKLVSDPNDPLSIGAFDTDIDRFDDGLLRIDGLDVSQQTLFQPRRYGGAPVINSRLTPRRTEDGFSVTTLTYTGAPIVYDEDENCAVLCTEVEALAQDRKDDGLFGCSVTGNDLDCEIKEIISEARTDQGVFTTDDFVSSGFLRDQIALRCAISGNDVDTCVVGAALLSFADVEPGEVDLIVDTFLQNDAEFLLPGDTYLIDEITAGRGSTIGPGDVERFLTLRRAVTNLYLNFSLVDADGNSLVTIEELSQFSDPQNDPNGDLARAAAFAVNDAVLSDEYSALGLGLGFRREDLAVAVVRSHGFTLSADLARQILESFPSVLDSPGDRFGFSLTAFDQSSLVFGSKSDASPALLLLLERAIANTSPTDRVTHNNLIARLPETEDGIRNNLITALYIEYADAIQDWLDAARPPAERPLQGNNWGKYAPWASQAIRQPITENTYWLNGFPAPIVPNLRQTSADGNQWIFHDVGSRMAAFIELIEADPDPTAAGWQNFFNDPDLFTVGEQNLRDGFVALAAARYEPDIERSQRLMFQSAMLFAIHEQAGVDPYLQPFDLPIVPAAAEAWFVGLEMGEDQEFSTGLDLYDDQGIEREGPAPQNNLIWDTDLLALDPSGSDLSTSFDAPGFDVELGGSSDDSVNVVEINGVPYDLTADWVDWFEENSPGDPDGSNGTYQGVRAEAWSDWEERMWYLANLFRFLHADPDLSRAPVGRDLDSEPLANLDPETIERLRVVE